MEERTQHRTRAPVRLRFVLDSRTTDLAVPAHAPLVDVLSTVLPMLNPDAPDHGAEHDGFVVARLAGSPLDEERTPTELELLDGETLYLRPRAPQLPPVMFDDLVDGMAEQVRGGSGVWTPARSAATWSAFAAVALLLVVPVLALGGPDDLRAVTAMGLSLVLLVGAGLASRAAARPVIGTVLAGVAGISAAAAGWYGGQWADPTSGWPLQVATATIAALTCLSLGLALVADATLLFTAAMTLGLTICLPAMVAAVGALPPQHAAATFLVASLVASLFLPLFAFRFSGLRLPLLPSTAKELAEHIDPVPQEVVVNRGTVTIRYLTALCVGLGVAQALLGAALIVPGGKWPLVLAVGAAAWLLLRSRHMGTAVQRWAVVTPAVLLAAGVAVRWSADHDFFVRAAVVLPVLATIGGLLAVGGAMFPGRRLTPYWGRAAELLETIVAVAILPVLGAVLDLYQIVRAWASGFA
ncbi:type VII secretion integral membrane protein EccD [Dactylosporangium sp. NBC_01737]|uniref:type VII secretion integral membrane protein EccD n=1 Tax=Dactylosporangium sp. NBC_01737 TaxID=2975959 RepID=UPI002E0D5F19|nr:type VII secretion integral membrane protein EccD [Dactylosporangium sp. NBC_01737]